MGRAKRRLLFELLSRGYRDATKVIDITLNDKN